MSELKSFTEFDIRKIITTLNDKTKPWVGYDFDGTMSYYNANEFSHTEFGNPIKPIIDLVLRDLKRGQHVRVFTARVHPLDKCILPNEYVGMAQERKNNKATFVSPTASLEELDAIAGIVAMRRWCIANIGLVLPITNIKDYRMVKLYDDRAVQVVHNEGTLIQ